MHTILLAVPIASAFVFFAVPHADAAGIRGLVNVVLSKFTLCIGFNVVMIVNIELQFDIYILCLNCE